MKKNIYKDKLLDKFGWDPIKCEGYIGNQYYCCTFASRETHDVEKGREATENNRRKGKKCACGNHSIPAHKQFWKYPEWKKRRKNNEDYRLHLKERNEL